MTKIAAMTIGSLLCTSLFARGLTPDMIRRNGLTDSQIDAVFAADSNAMLRLTVEHWRNIEYRMHRFDNMRGWLNEQIEGRLGDTILAVSDTNRIVIASNAVLRTCINRLSEDMERIYSMFTNQVAQTSSYSNLFVIAQAQAQVAQAKIRGEIADLKSKIAKYEEYKTKYPLLKSIWNAMINDAESRIKILESLSTN